MVTRCTVCNAIKTDATTHHTETKLGHAMNSGVVTTKASCTTNGVKTYTCTRNCGHTTTETIAMRNHSMGNWYTVTAATCEGEGTQRRDCQNNTATATHDACTYYEISNPAAIGHRWNDGVITTEPTCEGDGVKTFTCQNDNAHTYTEPVSAIGHAYGEANYVWADDNSTCTVTRICANDASHILTETVNTTSVTTDSTCTTEGTTVYTAEFTLEGAKTQTKSVTLPVDKDNHSQLVRVEAKDPTCTEIGWNAYEKCDKCGYTTYVELPAHGHKPGDEVIENEKEMTYDEATKVATDGGYDTVVYCTVCNCELSRESTTFHPVAYNVQQKTLYTIDTFQYGLDEAVAHERIILLECITVDDLNSLEDKVFYLDLNGYILTVTGTISMSANAHIVDFSEGDIGRMIVPEGQKINERNIELSIWDAEAVANGDGTFTGGYYFIDNKIVMQQLDPSISADGSTVKLTFRPIITDRATTEGFFSDGALDERIKIGVVFTLTDAQGNKYDDIKWLCTDELVKVVYNPSRPRAFEVTLDISDYALCSIKSIMISDLGVIRDGEEITVEGLGGREEEVPTPGEWE
ncbi:MAG: hypothetical protein IJA55_10115 [Clostridia bacterium]|nr:hypothetical protein [Clostridia bacterium]